jgi:Uma2 family endonuclease
MSVMPTVELGPQVDRPLTVADLEELQDEGYRYELDDGVLVVYSAPVIRHQLVVHRLQLLLDDTCPSELMVIPGPGIEMSDIQYRVPDLVIVRTALISMADRSITVPPELAIEVASPSTAHYDRNRKKTVYAEFGIPAYWIVVPDPDQPSITAYDLAGGSYTEVGRAAGDQLFVARSPFPVEIFPAHLVAGPWRRDRPAG